MLSSFLRRPLRIDESLTHCYSPMKEIAVNRVSRTPQNEWLVLPEFVQHQETSSWNWSKVSARELEWRGIDRNGQEPDISQTFDWVFTSSVGKSQPESRPCDSEVAVCLPCTGKGLPWMRTSPALSACYPHDASWNERTKAQISLKCC